MAATSAWWRLVELLPLPVGHPVRREGGGGPFVHGYLHVVQDNARNGTGGCGRP